MTKVLEKQVRPINEIFGLNADLSPLEKTASIDQERRLILQEDTFAVKLSTSVPQTDFSYSLLRDGVVLDSQSTTIQLGDTIQFKPKTDDVEIDWFIQGSAADSPPITILPRSEAQSLYRELYLSYLRKYPAAQWGNSASAYAAYTAPKFSTKITDFKASGNYYIADNGYPAYLVPMAGGKKAGFQMFYSPDLRTDSTDCKIRNGVLECVVTKSGSLPITVSGASFLHVDKIIDGTKAIDAGWVAYLGKNATIEGTTDLPYSSTEKTLRLQVVPRGKSAPMAEFECKAVVRGTPSKAYVECDASASKDPDGEIKRYDWSTNNKSFTQIFASSANTSKPVFTYGSFGNLGYARGGFEGLGSLTISLKVTDNDGYFGEKYKTFDLTGETLREISPAKRLSFAAYYNPSTKKADLTLSNCPAGSTQAFIDIDLLGADSKPTLSVLEKQSIACEQTTEVGPITAKGVYQATAKIGSETLTAIFSVP
ncbi:MAG: hypothetical protein QXK06_02555 [Candidatus Diapherotrites archaeon]